FLGLDCEKENLEQVFKRPTAGLEIAGGIKTKEPDLAAIKASRLDQSECLLGPNVVELCRMADIVFMAFHGDIGENGKLQATFDVLGIRYTGAGYLGSALAMDKDCTKQIFKMSNIPTPDGAVLRPADKDRPISDFNVGLPAVLKPCSGGSSIGVYIVHTPEEYKRAVEESFLLENEIILEPYIKGKEYTVGIVDGKALPIVEIIPKAGFFDYANKYQDDCTEEICPAHLDPNVTNQMQDIAVKAFRALKLQIYGRADFILSEQGELYCLEVNSLPGMTPASLLPKEAKAEGMSYGDLCELIIHKSLERYA
ncbi:MAG: D-alanine--D-alanine ligase, partial [Lachnospiraceae bacterium]